MTSDLGVPQKLDSDGSGRLDCREFCNAIKKLVTSGRVWSKQRDTYVQKKLVLDSLKGMLQLGYSMVGFSLHAFLSLVPALTEKGSVLCLIIKT